VTCGGGTCQTGICSLVTTVDGGKAPPVGDFPCIAVDSQYVYVATGLFAASGNGLIYRVPVNGGAPQTILPSQDRPHGIGTDGTNLYWADYAAGTIRTSAPDGSNPTTIVMSQSSPYALALDATHVFWKNAGDGTMWQADRNGNNQLRLANGLATGGANAGYI